jgi:glycosyltransferase involved in cell wall biosynthesis
MLQSWYGWFMWMSTRVVIRQTVREFKPDAVLSYWAHPDGEVALRAAKLAGVPSAVIVGGSDVLILPEERRRRRAIIQVLNESDAVITVGEDLRQKTIKLGVSPDRIHVVLQGIDSRHFHPGDRAEARRKLGLPEHDNILLWVGRMVPVKGLEILLEACKHLRKRSLDVLLCLVGDGPQRAMLEAEVARLGLSDRIRFVGAVSHEQLPAWYQSANLTVLSSHSEGVPNVLRESLACGIPYVATRVGGVAELSNDPANRLVPPGDAIALATAIEQAIDDRRPLCAAQSNFDDWGTSASTLLSVLANCRQSSRTLES